MFDVGGGELLLALVIALVVLGPERLPEVARTMGRWTGRAKSLFNNLRYELEREAYNKELQEKFDTKMKEMGIDPESLKQPGGTPEPLMKDVTDQLNNAINPPATDQLPPNESTVPAVDTDTNDTDAHGDKS